MNRKKFLSTIGGGTLALTLAPNLLLAENLKFLDQNSDYKLTILHTNDQHSRIEPFDSSYSRNPNQGGFARRAALIQKIRGEEKNVLLLDSGDTFQGTPYFNFYGGRVEAKALEMMGYDAVTFGNHEFDNGMDSLALVLREVHLPVVNANYDFQQTPLMPFIQPYKIIRKGGLKIGVFGIGVNLKGLAFQKNFAGLMLKEPIESALQTSDYLRNSLKCDLVICLSHLGVSSLDSKPTDYDLAAVSRNIDVIIGGHSHKMLVNETAVNAGGKSVIIAQMGKSGQNLGRIDLTLEKKPKK